MEKQKFIYSKDILNADKVNENIDTNPQESLTELARVLNLNIQRAQLNDLNVDTALDICSMIKASANITLSKWMMKSNLKKSIQSLK